ncbi:MAG: hypothetical protein ACRBBW_04210 [Cellvibrionaceae bacterium]
MNSLVTRYEQLSSRERVLILIVAAACVYFLFSLTVFSYFDGVETRRQQQLTLLEQQNDQLDAELKLYSSLLNTDPDKAKKQQVRSLKVELATLETSLNRLSVGLIPADELPKLLKRVLQKIKRLKLQSIRTLPISELSLKGEVIDAEEKSEGNSGDTLTENSASPSATSGDQNKVETAGVFKHAVEVQWGGGYFETQRFISALEELPWRLYWDNLNYSVTDYPNANVSLQVYTLSTDRGAFGGRP